MTEETKQVTIEEAINLYEQKIQEQTTLIFGLVAKLGGKVVLTQSDFDEVQEYNTVLAESTPSGDVELRVVYEERPDDPTE
jgi:hypothetical protein